ncbi:MAG TPA: septum site-determining protein Ssd [Pseudonocardia sp.]|nr:septum site-determining protein Ssd [Pseudonocardia sp.]
MVGSIDAAHDGAAGRRPLVMISDAELFDAVCRLAAAAGCRLQPAPDLGQLRRSWPSAPLVLLDAAAIDRCAELGLDRRGQVVVVLTRPVPPEVLEQALVVGAERVVMLPEDELWLVNVLTEAAEGPPRAGPVLAVVGGRGGAGASVLAAAVAVTAVRDGERALLVDCDPLGGGLDLVLAAEDVAGLRWADISVGGGRVPATAWHAALPSPAIGGRGAGELGLLSCDRTAAGPAPAAVEAVMHAGRRAGELVICDLPRYPTDAAVRALTGADLTLLVVPADLRSCAAGARVAAVLAEHSAAVQLVVRGPAPGGIGPVDVAGALGLPLLVAMRPEPRLDHRLERGELPRPRGPLAGAARAVLAALRATT